MKFENQNILVVGGAGFIGSHLVDQLILENPKSIHVVDNLFLGKKENLKEAKFKFANIHFHKMDATDKSKLQKLIKKEYISTVFNLATKALGYSFYDPLDSFQVNTLIAGNLLESLRKSEIKNLIHFSSSEVYGSAISLPMNEQHPLKPHTTYAAGKASADLLIHSYQKSFGVKVLIIRPFNNYGPRQNEGLYAGVIPITIKRILEGLQPVIQGDGQQTRDFIYVGNTVFLSVSLAKKEELYGQVINLGSGYETKIRDVIKIICKISNYKGPIKNEQPRPGDVNKHCADITLLNSLLKKAPLQSIEEGLIKTWQWYSEHKNLK